MSDAQILHLFGGKGGVGKTTLSAAFALNLADRRPKEKVLLVSSDPGRALSDLLKKKLTHKPTKLTAAKGVAGLYAAEFDPAATMVPFMEVFTPGLEKSLSAGAVLTVEDLRRMLGPVSSGIEELVGLLGLTERLADGDFDRVVLDTAATAHLLRMLDVPAALKRLVAHLRGQAGKGKKDAPPAGYLEGLMARLDALMALLRDPERTSFHLTTQPEPVAEAQTRMLFNQLRERGVPVSEVVVNLVEDGDGCPACQGRRGLQAPHVRKYQLLDKTLPVSLLARREIAPRGLEALRQLAKDWAGGKETKALEFGPAEGPPALVRAPSMPPIAAPPLSPTRLIFFVGQGGVGKSSCAAAAAVTLTEKEGPVLLISADPAHSLSDVLQSRLTDTETQVKGTKGLYARELDIQGWFNALRKRLREKADLALDGAAKTPEALLDREVLRNLLDCAPPCIDELAAISVLADALFQERFKRIVVDPSPSTQGVRILQVPEAARGWLEAVHAVLVRHKARGLGPLAEEVAGLLKRVKRFEQALSTPAESRFVVVSRAEELAGPRTERLVEWLKERNLATERVLVNRILPKSACPRCENRRKGELLAAKNTEKRLGLPITVAPALGRHPAGLRELKAFRTAWYALSAPPAKIKAA